MFDFCPHCGQTIEVEQVAGRMLICGVCGKDIGFVGAVQRTAGDEIEARIRAGTAARCHVCQQAVEVKSSASAKTLVPHFGSSATRKICRGSGKPVAAVAPVADAPGSAHVRLSAHMTHDVLKVISCTKGGKAQIEVLTLDYLDKSERVRIQVEALREMLGFSFQMREYPKALNKPHLTMWVGDDACVVAARHERGGFQSIADEEVAAVLADLREHPSLFFACAGS